MSTRTTNRGMAHRAGRCVLRARRPRRRAPTAAKKKAAAADKSDKPDKADDADESSDPEVKLPPVLLKALHEKEAEVTAARREAIGLHRELPARQPALARSRPRRCTSWPSSTGKSRRRSTSRRWGRYQDAVTACHNDRAQCPHVPRKPPTVDLSQAQAVYLRLINNYPKFRKIDTVIYLYAFSLRDQGKIGESIKYFQIILDKYPRSRYIADAWMAIAEYRFYEQQNYKSSLEAYEKVLKHPKSQLYDLALFKTAWCYWKLGDTNKSALRFKDVLDLAKKKAGRDRGAAEARRGAAGAGARLPGRAVHRGRHQERARRVRVPGADRRQAVLAQGAASSWPTPCSTRPATSAPSRPTGCSSSWIPTAPRRPTTTARSSSRTSCWATSRPRSPRCASWPATTARAAPGPPPTRIARRPSSTRARWPRGSSATWPRPCTPRRSRTRRRPRSSTRTATRAPPRPTSSTWPTSPTRPTPSSCATCAPTSSTSSCGKYEEAGREYLAVGKTQPVGKYHKDALLQAMGAFEKVRKPARRRQARDHRQRSPVRRGGRPLRDAVPQGQGDRHRHLQERSVLLRLRRLRRGDQALRPDRRALPRRSERRARRATASCRRSTRRRTTRTSRPGRGASRRPRRSRRRTSRSASTS